MTRAVGMSVPLSDLLFQFFSVDDFLLLCCCDAVFVPPHPPTPQGIILCPFLLPVLCLCLTDFFAAVILMHVCLFWDTCVMRFTEIDKLSCFYHDRVVYLDLQVTADEFECAGSKSLWKQETSKIFAVHLATQFQSLTF